MMKWVHAMHITRHAQALVRSTGLEARTALMQCGFRARRWRAVPE